MIVVTSIRSFVDGLLVDLEVPYARTDAWDGNISRRIAQITKATFDVKAGSLFPALHRMEEAGWLTSSWGESETNRRARFYRLTAVGRKRLHAESERWERISLAMASALRAT